MTKHQIYNDAEGSNNDHGTNTTVSRISNPEEDQTETDTSESGMDTPTDTGSDSEESVHGAKEQVDDPADGEEESVETKSHTSQVTDNFDKASMVESPYTVLTARPKPDGTFTVSTTSAFSDVDTSDPGVSEAETDSDPPYKRSGPAGEIPSGTSASGVHTVYGTDGSITSLTITGCHVSGNAVQLTLPTSIAEFLESMNRADRSA